METAVSVFCDKILRMATVLPLLVRRIFEVVEALKPWTPITPATSFSVVPYSVLTVIVFGDVILGPTEFTSISKNASGR